MRKSEALKLKRGDEITYQRWKTGRVVTVAKVLTEPTAREPEGHFPLIKTKEDGAMCYLFFAPPVGDNRKS